MPFYVGHNARKIKVYSRGMFAALCRIAENDGYELHKQKIKTDWPRFWRTKYKAEYRRYYIIDDSKIAFFSKREIDRIIGK